MAKEEVGRKFPTFVTIWLMQSKGEKEKRKRKEKMKEKKKAKKKKGERGGNRIEEIERKKRKEKGVSLFSKIYRNRAIGFRRSKK